MVLHSKYFTFNTIHPNTGGTDEPITKGINGILGHCLNLTPGTSKETIGHFPYDSTEFPNLFIPQKQVLKPYTSRVIEVHRSKFSGNLSRVVTPFAKDTC